MGLKAVAVAETLQTRLSTIMIYLKFFSRGRACCKFINVFSEAEEKQKSRQWNKGNIRENLSDSHESEIHLDIFIEMNLMWTSLNVEKTSERSATWPGHQPSWEVTVNSNSSGSKAMFEISIWCDMFVVFRMFPRRTHPSENIQVRSKDILQILN